MFQSEMSDLMSGISPELLLLGHEEEIENQVSEILLQDFNDFQKFALQHHQEDGFNKKHLMEEVTTTNNDMYYPSANPSDITGQSLAATMETDKTKVLNSMATSTNSITPMLSPVKLHQSLPFNWMESTTVDFSEPSKASEKPNANDGIQETQDTIDEIQDFLDQFTDESMDQNEEVQNLANELLSEGQRANLEAMNVADCPLANSTMNEEDLNAAEDLLDQLIQGNFTSEEIKELEQTSDSGYTSSAQPTINVSNVSEIITEDGQNIIIVIAPSRTDDEQAINAAPTTPNGTNEVLASINVPVSGESYPPTEMETSEDEGNNSGGDDSDWSPSLETPHSQSKADVASKKNKPGRRMQERNTSTVSTASSGRISKSKSVKDRKERKKMQNVEAARRYRDKKKAEESKVEEEERLLLNKNSKLKETLNGIEGELNTIKKLMTELGLIKLVTPKISRGRK